MRQLGQQFMDENIKALVMSKVSQGESLVKLVKSPRLKMICRQTVIRWVLKEKLPAVKVGRNYFSTDSLIVEAIEKLASAPLKQSTTKTVDPASKNESHEKAVESLKRRGVIKTAKPFKA